LIVELGDASSEQASKFGVAQGSKVLTYDFVLVTDQESKALRDKHAIAAMEAQGRKMKLWEGLPIPDID
jgi:hypothetical protein